MTGVSSAIESAERPPRNRVRESMVLTTLDRLLRNPQGIIGLAGVLLLVVVALAAPLVTRYGPIDQSYPGAARFLEPSWDHPFGTDHVRRDVFSRTIFGLRTSLAVSLFAVSVGAAAGIALGFVAGYAGGIWEALVMRTIDALLAFPGLLAALAIVTILGPGPRNVGLAIVFFSIPAFARLARGQMLREKSRDYVKASQALGAGPLRIIFRHIAMNALPPLLTQVALAMSSAILLAAALSFLGLGERPPDPSLGGLVNDAKPYLREAWWLAVFPGAVLAFLLLCLNFLADAINEATNPYAGRRI